MVTASPPPELWAEIESLLHLLPQQALFVSGSMLLDDDGRLRSVHRKGALEAFAWRTTVFRNPQLRSCGTLIAGTRCRLNKTADKTSSVSADVVADRSDRSEPKRPTPKRQG